MSELYYYLCHLIFAYFLITFSDFCLFVWLFSVSHPRVLQCIFPAKYSGLSRNNLGKLHMACWHVEKLPTGNCQASESLSWCTTSQPRFARTNSSLLTPLNIQLSCNSRSHPTVCLQPSWLSQALVLQVYLGTQAGKGHFETCLGDCRTAVSAQQGEVSITSPGSSLQSDQGSKNQILALTCR